MSTTLAQQLQQTRKELSSVAGDLAALEARLLAQHAWSMTPEDLLKKSNILLSADMIQQMQYVTERRLRREPIAQIMGEKDFWKHSFLVSRDVLTPRADSELIIETVIKHQREKDAAVRVLDLGTGSGCLVLSVLGELPKATAMAVDYSTAALDVAKANAKRLELSHRISFLRGEWCKPLDKAERFAIVISNPPYIARAEINTLAEDVKGYEPYLALDGGLDGLDCYRAIFSQLTGHLEDGALVVMEVGAGQAEAVKQLGEASGLTHKETNQDLGGVARVVVFRN